MSTPPTGNAGRPPGVAVTYPDAYFARAYLRAGGGVVGMAVLWLILPSSLAVTGICVAGGLCFLLYGADMRLRQMSSVHWDSEGIHVDGPRPRMLSWSRMRSVRLSYFSTRRDGKDGWMQLKIKGGDGVLRVDSDASGFDQLVIVAMHHVDRLGLDVTATTRHNAAVLFKPGGLRPQ